MDGKIIMLASGKGGTGKSTVSVLLGAQLAATGKRVLLVELDSGLRSVDVISGVASKTVYDVGDVLSGRCDSEKAIVESPLYPELFIISAPYEGGDIREEGLASLCRVAKRYFDYILLDTAAGLGSPFIAASKQAEMALIVLTPDPVCLRDGRIVSDTLFEAGIKEIRLVLNRTNTKSFKGRAVKNLDECIDTVCAQLIGVIPESLQLQKSTAQSEALNANCPAFSAIRRIARRILGSRVPLIIE